MFSNNVSHIICNYKSGICMPMSYIQMMSCEGLGAHPGCILAFGLMSDAQSKPYNSYLLNQDNQFVKSG